MLSSLYVGTVEEEKTQTTSPNFDNLISPLEPHLDNNVDNHERHVRN